MFKFPLIYLVIIGVSFRDISYLKNFDEGDGKGKQTP